MSPDNLETYITETNKMLQRLPSSEEWVKYEDAGVSQPADTLGSTPFGTDHVLLHSPLFRRYNLPHMADAINARSNFSRLQIPDFLNLTTPHIERHAMKLKSLCTNWESPNKDQILRFEVINHHQVSYSRTPLPSSAKVTVKDLALQPQAQAKFVALAAKRYDPATDIFKMAATNLPTRQLNKVYLRKVLEDLIAAANEPDPDFTTATKK